MRVTLKEERFIKKAYTDVPFYARKAEKNRINVSEMDLQKDWQFIPTIKKSEIIEAGDGMLMPEGIPLWLSGRLAEVYTSGSSGHCMKVYWRSSDSKKSLLSLWKYRKKEYGISPEEHYCYFYSARKYGTTDVEIEEIKNQMGFSKNNLTEDRFLDVYHKMQEYQPSWLLLQPVMAMFLIELVKKYSLLPIPSIRYIEMSGEMLTRGLRNELKNIFQCKVANQYGAIEVNSIAYECPLGNMHCMEENVFTEILDEDGNPQPDGEEGNIYVTSLQNRIMPFIRYKTGDRGYICKEDCGCGRKGRVLCLTQGRETDWIQTASGKRINPYVLMRPIENINRMLDNPIMQFQVVQRGYSEFTYKLVAEEEMQFEIRRLIKENICEKELLDSNVKVEFINRIFPNEETGKVKWFIRKEES